MSEGRADLRDARCNECGARCIPGETHLEHNGGWKKKVLMWDYSEIQLAGYPEWDLVDPGGGWPKHPPCVTLAIKNKVDKDSYTIAQEFDEVAIGKFYYNERSRDGSCSVAEGEIFDAHFHFQKREDAYAFIKRYGGMAG